MKIYRKITKYSKKTEELLDEFDVSLLKIKWLKNLFSPPKNDPLMYNVYSINEYESNILKEYLDLEFDLYNFDYFLECYYEDS
jgi:hypothetical protein